ncbi:solute carrier organic anion transporter [bacterium]|nr:solute carrier organic anion transporter [bacterium]MBU1650734.1 solute carrier organic anion transporter [bacterium]MBU1881141.1 solute carrier organic anion transporter [bacterium]
MNLWSVSGLIFLLNLPFGYWRAGLKRYSLLWFLAIHIPVPLAVGLRFLAGLGWRLSSLPYFVGAFFLGQLLGGMVKKVFQKTAE